MATIEFLQKRLDGAEANLNKLQSKLARIKKAEASNWEVNPYYYNKGDMKYTLRDIETANQSIANYKAEIQSTIEKNNSRDVTVILEFLENWKKRVYALVV